MKRIFLLMLALGGFSVAEEKSPAPAEAPENAETAFVNGVEALQKVYRAQIAKEIEKADRIVLCRFGEERAAFRHGSVDGEGAPIYGEQWELWFRDPLANGVHRIAKSVTLSESQRKAFLPKLHSTLAGTEDNAISGCHFPRHGVRLYEGERLIMEADICLECDGYCMHYPMDSLWSRHAMVPGTIQPILLELLPVPERPKTAEKDDFDAAK